MKRLPIQALAGLLGFVPAALAQGSDSCTAAQSINGLGTFPWTNAAATLSPEGQPTCVGSINRDVWFTWTAPVTDQFSIDTCGTVNWDCVVAVYAGAGCPTGPSIACNDDGCGTQSRVSFQATAGTAYTFQLGSYFTGGGSGTFQINQGGPPGCSPAVGPDVIVGDVSDVGNYSVLNGIDALALGTTSCNMGNANLSWVASTNQHPVIGGNVYRYKTVDGAGRFEQVGMSWLKHGFTALSGSLCCPCQGGGGSQLGVGCSDPYSSGLNGSQPSLGPRWQVNASTGAFTYPPANPAWSGSTARRIEIALADIDLTSQYFGECQYVTPDDAAAGNQNNNASTRRLSVSGTSANYNFEVNLGPTMREVSAIQVWAQLDNEVQLSDVQVAGDGRFIVGSRTTEIVPGTWRYEYAVYNMNSHRSGGSFSVPVPVGATVTNAGFHGVVYRNGDGPSNINMSSADWAFSISGGAATWATDPESLDQRANALRWGTTYNFRFDANVAPAAGTASLGLWRTDIPAGTTAAAKVPGPLNGSASVCFGDGSGTHCPCGNNGGPGQGCLNSMGAAGTLQATGTASVASDSLLLSGGLMPNAACLYFQGSSLIGNGAGATFGDGLRCAGGTVVRLGTKNNVSGQSAYPGIGDPSVSVRGSCAPGDVRVYQAWYRNAAVFCTSATYNLTNAWQIVWQS